MTIIDPPEVTGEPGELQASSLLIGMETDAPHLIEQLTLLVTA